jgi:hypothetical protein
MLSARLATLVLLLPIGFVTHPTFYLVIGFALLVGVVVSEHLLTYAFGECLRPNQPRTGPMLRPSVSESWCGLVGFFRAFVLLEAPLLTTLCLTAPSHKLVSWEVLRAVMVVAALWWWVALGSAIVVQRASVSGRIGLILLIPILAGMGWFAGMVAWLAGVRLFIPDFFE